jgi:hypothetical protein
MAYMLIFMQFQGSAWEDGRLLKVGSRTECSSCISGKTSDDSVIFNDAAGASLDGLSFHVKLIFFNHIYSLPCLLWISFKSLSHLLSSDL